MAGKIPKDSNFAIKGTTLVKYKGEGLTTVIIPKGITKISKEAFKEPNETITEIIIPEGTITIDRDSSGTKAFGGCRKLKKLVIHYLK